jgi:hypothetical protein
MCAVLLSSVCLQEHLSGRWCAWVTRVLAALLHPWLSLCVVWLVRRSSTSCAARPSHCTHKVRIPQQRNAHTTATAAAAVAVERAAEQRDVVRASCHLSCGLVLVHGVVRSQAAAEGHTAKLHTAMEPQL